MKISQYYHDEVDTHPRLIMETLKDQRGDANDQSRRGHTQHQTLIAGKEKTDQGVTTDDHRSQELVMLRRAGQRLRYIDQGHQHDRRQTSSRKRARIGAAQ